ncbi:MAG: GntR family transcriptional regulator [Pseudomonadales bacterium]|nr:GntR family transcriptional regulator [Pseudomonadales bacterium]
MEHEIESNGLISLGHRYLLTVVKIVDFGVFVDAGNLGEILLPKRDISEPLAVGDQVDVFIHLDSKDKLIATTQQSKAEVGEFAYLNAIANTDFGTFLDWGLDKDLLVPFGEQHKPMLTGHAYLVYIYVGKNDQRITASSKIEKFLDDDKEHDFRIGQAVKLIIANTTELGFKAIINHSHWGLLYKNEVQQKLSFGQSQRGFIKYVRPDGRIDLSLDGGQPQRDKNTTAVLDYLKKANGFAPLHDKSAPDEIKRALGMSKKAFKKAIGGLYKQKIITIESNGIRLILKA